MRRLLRGSALGRLVGPFVAAFVVAGCAGSVNVPVTSPFYGTSLPPYDAVVRHHLLDPTDAGLRAVREAAPRDEVIRLMNTGLMLHRMGRFEESNDSLQRAERVATDRYTRSILQDLASFVVSDNAVDYQASALERSMIHYYGMLNYLALSQPEEALVEARRANALLRRYSNDFPDRSFVNDAAVQYMAGMLQWGERDENDAIVSLRTARTGYGEYEANYGVRIPEPVAVDVARVARAVGLDDVADEVIRKELQGRDAQTGEPARGSDFGDVVLVIENGFIAYKRQQKLFVPILKSERDAVVSGGAAAALAASFDVMLRTVIIMTEMSREGQDYVQAHEDGVTFVSGALSAVGLELITMAWATYEPGTRRASAIQVTAADGRSWSPTVMEDLSAIAVRDFEERKTSMLVRMTARTLLKEAGVIQSERAGERAGGVLGGLAARVAARTVANATERADTRSWSGLPAELLLTRLRLPPGRHELVVEYRGMNGPDRKTVTVDVVAGRVALATVAIAGRDDWDRDRLRRASRNVRYSVPPRSARVGPGAP